jgi:hypothetical protein
MAPSTVDVARMATGNVVVAAVVVAVQGGKRGF